jgi:hypothetical protein
MNLNVKLKAMVKKKIDIFYACRSPKTDNELLDPIQKPVYFITIYLVLVDAQELAH